VNDDYLWDGSGEPDPEVQRLEAILRPLRGHGRTPELPALGPPSRTTSERRRGLAAAAAVLVALAAVGVRERIRGGWEVAWLEGPSWEEARVVREGRLGPREWIDTAGGRARLQVGRIGRVELEPGTRLERLDAGPEAHRLALAVGTLHAFIWAPPGQFAVEAPSAVAVDLGCRYTLEVLPDGSGRLGVEAGWVGFEHAGIVSLVPEGAVADTRPGWPPGTPHYLDASPAFGAALDGIDFGASPRARRAALAVALAEARPRDGLSLWHLLTRVPEEDRGLVFDRLAALVPPPSGVTRHGACAGDPAMLDTWWAELGLGSADFWRRWTTSWSSAPVANAGR
jgi:hypothetical protein